jgi:hypothetical protein
MYVCGKYIQIIYNDATCMPKTGAHISQVEWRQQMEGHMGTAGWTADKGLTMPAGWC